MSDFNLVESSGPLSPRKVTPLDDITNFAMSKVLPVLHRQLLRLARGLDAYPLSKALLLAQPDAVFDRSRDAVVSLPKIKGAAGEWARLLSEFNGGEYYQPESLFQTSQR